jgi:hypothetical protein
VVHHALYNVLAPIFEAAFVFDSYACRKGKGTHAAVDRFTHLARRHRYLLECDVCKYFPSIDHEILKGAIARKVKDGDVLWLVERIIDASNPQEPVQEWFRGDDLFGPSLRRRGLPLGNQTSQIFANVYLDAFDHWVCEILRPAGYVRYVDDFVLFHDDRAWLAEARERCRERLAGLRLRLHPRKVVLSRVEDGTRFLGYRVFPGYRRLPAAGVVRIKRRLRRLAADCAAGRLSVPEVRQRIAAWVGHAAQANTFRLRQRLRQSQQERARQPQQQNRLPSRVDGCRQYSARAAQAARPAGAVRSTDRTGVPRRESRPPSCVPRAQSSPSPHGLVGNADGPRGCAQGSAAGLSPRRRERVESGRSRAWRPSTRRPGTCAR